MALLCSITEGWTAELGPFTLRVDGAPLSLTGLTVEIILSPQEGAASDTSADVRQAPDQVANPGQVYFKPDATDLEWRNSPYTLRWKVTDGAGDVVFLPNGVPDTIAVYKP